MWPSVRLVRNCPQGVRSAGQKCPPNRSHSSKSLDNPQDYKTPTSFAFYVFTPTCKPFACMFLLCLPGLVKTSQWVADPEVHRTTCTKDRPRPRAAARPSPARASWSRSTTLCLSSTRLSTWVSHYQPSTACVISSVRTVLTTTDCVHKTAPALVRFPHLARARSDVFQELGRLVAISKKASAPDVADDERTWLAENMLRYGDAVFASCKRYVEVAVSSSADENDDKQPAPAAPVRARRHLSPLRLSALLDAQIPDRPRPSLPTLICPPNDTRPPPIYHCSLYRSRPLSRASHASSKGHLIEMTRETVDKVRKVLTIVGAVCDHPAVVGPEKVALAAAKDALYGATSVLVEAVKRMLAPAGAVGGVGRKEEEKAVAVQAATGTLRAGGVCVTAVRSCLTRHTGAGYGGTIGGGMYPLVFEVPAAPPSVLDHARSMSSGSGSEASTSLSMYAVNGNGYVNGTVRAGGVTRACASLVSQWPRRPSVGEEEWNRR
ncbi:hypothetical protein FRC12_004988 [Ceratobasidium sp. 428]|nr:hypothetical protein FRC12_004988 [Ceratobasidium sp. 428]